MKKQTKRYAFTLLEILICLSLLSFIGGLFGVKAKELFSLYQTREEIMKVRSLVQMAKLHSSCYGTDVSVIFQKKKMGWYVGLFSDEPALRCRKDYQMQIACKKLTSIEGLIQERGTFSIVFTASGFSKPHEEFYLVFCGKREKIKPLG